MISGHDIIGLVQKRRETTLMGVCRSHGTQQPDQNSETHLFFFFSFFFLFPFFVPFLFTALTFFFILCKFRITFLCFVFFIFSFLSLFVLLSLPYSVLLSLSL